MPISKISKFLVEELLKEESKVTNFVVVYSGRFQPFHKGHYATYDHLVKKFGKENVFIGTSNKTDNDKSPFNFKEKKSIMTTIFGIPSNKIVQVKNPYAPTEILDNYDENTTALITVVGEKDTMRLGGKYFTPYKGKVETGYKDKGYVYIAPAQTNPISGTEVRKWLGNGNVDEKKQGFLKAYPKFNQKIFDLITNKLKSLSEFLSETSSLGFGADDGEPETGYVSDGQKRVLNGGKPEPWFKQGSYIQLDKPKGDYMRGKGKNRDTESQFRKVVYKLKNVEQSTLNPVEKPESVDNWKEIKPKKKNIIKKDKRYWELEESKNIITKSEIDSLAEEMFEALGLAMGYPSKAQLIQKEKERQALRKKMDKQSDYYEKVKEDKIPGGKSQGKTLSDIAKMHKVELSDLVDEFKKGYKVEREHTTDINVAKEIAMDHLYEDPKYYTKLSKIEESTPINLITKSLGILRKDMPQIKSSDMRDYLEFLKSNDIKVSAKSIPVYKVAMTQKDFNIDKIQALMRKEKTNLAKPVIISKDAYILDGHHRVLALYNLDKNFKLNTIFVDLGIKDLLKITKDFPKVSYKNIDEYVMYKTGHIMPPAPFRGLGMSDEKLKDLEKKNEAYTKGQLFTGTIKIGGEPVKVEVELIGADNKNKTFITKVIHIDKKHLMNKLPSNGILEIPARIFRFAGDWRKIKTPSIFSENSNTLNAGSFNLPDAFFGGEIDISSDENLDLENPQGWESFNKATNKFKKKSLGEGLITEGGAYGHMNHPFDLDVNLTFGQLKDIVKKALTGKLELTREKTDGQALAISWVNGRLVAARNKSHLKNKGKDALDINGVADKFSGRGALTDAYNFAMKDLSVAISGLTDKQKEKIFKGGSSFMNIEVIYPESANVIPYGQALLVFHGSFDYDDAGNVISEDTSSGRILAGMVKQINQHVQSKYSIQGPPVTKLPESKELAKLQPKYLAKINKLQSEFKLSDNSGVADYHQAWWANFVNKGAKKLDAQQKIGLVKRWAFGDKSFRIKDIKDDKLREWAEGVDKGDQQKISKENLMKFEEIFLGVGADVLSFMSSVLTVNPDSAKRAMVDRLEKTINDIQASGDAKKIEKLKLELTRLESLGGFDKIVPTEGIVFSYNNYTMKLTGAFAPLNQLLGIMYY